MLQRTLVLGLTLALLSTLAAVAALQSGTGEAGAQARGLEMDTICLEVTTGLYKGSLTGSCPPGHRTLDLPDSFPLTLCASAFDGFLRAPLANGQCPPYTRVRIELPSPAPYSICYSLFTGRLRIAAPYPNGACTTGSRPITLPNGLEPADDAYQTLGNVDIAVPASAGMLANDGGLGLSVVGLNTAGMLGSVVIQATDGSFSYTPPAGFAGDDSFGYTVEDGAGNSATATVTIQVLAPAVWFVDAEAAGPGDGRRETPLNSLDPLNDTEADLDQPGDFIFLYEASLEYQASFELEVAQSIIGQELNLADVLTEALDGASTLQGAPVASLPPFLVLPDADPTADVPVLLNSDPEPPLNMASGTLAAGFHVQSHAAPAVTALDALDVVLDRMDITGGVNTEPGGDAHAGVELVASALQITESIIRGGDTVAQPQGGSSLQGMFTTAAGPGVVARDSELAVAASTVRGGDAFSITATADTHDLATVPGDGSYGGSAIVANATDVSISNASVIAAGASNAHVVQGMPGIAISSIALDSSLQGPPPAAFSALTVSNSVVTGAAGAGDPFLDAGDGGPGIAAFMATVTVEDGASVSGGGGGVGQSNAGDGGGGIVWDSAWFMTGNASVETGATLQGPPSMPSEPLVSVLNASVSGGAGGDTQGFIAGDGGDGITVDSIDLLPISSASASGLAGPVSDPTVLRVENASITGGDAGDTPDPTTNGLGGVGGHGIALNERVPIAAIDTPNLLGVTGDDGSALILTSQVTGGNGGQGGDRGGAGGDGIIARLVTLRVEAGSTISGGDGGRNDTDFHGDGGDGLTIEDLDAAVTDSQISGGDGATAPSPDGQGGLAIHYENGESQNARLDLLDNVLAYGRNPHLLTSLVPPIVDIEQHGSGTICVHAAGNAGAPGSTFVFSAFSDSGYLGITQLTSDSFMVANNGIALEFQDVPVGQFIHGCASGA